MELLLVTPNWIVLAFVVVIVGMFIYALKVRPIIAQFKAQRRLDNPNPDIAITALRDNELIELYTDGDLPRRRRRRVIREMHKRFGRSVLEISA